jgi:hypothetical protein
MQLFPAYAAYAAFPAFQLVAPLRYKGCAACQILDKSGMIAPEGVINGYCILDTVYNGISTFLGFCQVLDLDVRHPKYIIDF